MPDLIVVGGGIAGLQAALEAKKRQAEVLLLSKAHPTRTYSVTVQDGFNAALNPEDSWELHAQDTVHGGDYLGDQEAVELMCRQAPEAIRELDRMGVPFNRDARGHLATVELPGSSRARSCYVDDMTGHVLVQVLYEQALKEGIPIYSEWFVTSLLMEEGVCRGVLALELRTGRLYKLSAKAVILATGGPRRLYEPSTSSLNCTADGLSLAYRAGAPLVDMEFIQYHPAVLRGSRMALSELLLAEEHQLLNAEGASFLEQEAPRMKEKAFQDVRARAIARQEREGAGTQGGVLLKVRLDPQKRESVYFNTHRFLSSFMGLDLSKDPIPVRPAMHRSLGGVQVDLNGATPLPGLYAAGECAGSGVHGASGLDGNFLLASVISGKQAGAAAADYAREAPLKEGSDALLKEEEDRLARLFHREGTPGTPARIRQELAQTMHQKVGLFRHASGLKEASLKIAELRERYERLGVQSRDKNFNFELMNLLELGFLLDTAEVVVLSAMERLESRGVHYRTDYPGRDDTNWLKHIVVTRHNGSPRLDYRPVSVTRWPPRPRDY